VQITHIGHACLFVEAADARVLIDPGAFSHGFEELRDLDAVFVTHSHWDHIDAERLSALLAANPGVTVHAEAEAAGQVRGAEATVLAAGDTVTVKGLTVSGVGGQHAVIHPDLPRIGNVGVVLTADGEPTLYHPGDALTPVPTGIDVLALPIVAPWAALADAVDFGRAVGAPLAFPIHDALLAGPGREVYHRVGGQLLGPATEWRVIADQGPVKI
jgi:L-ascorbate metabolism protein UlaG (beta-lactamase superfamily)